VVKAFDSYANTASKFHANKYRELDEGFSKVPIALARADLRKALPHALPNDKQSYL
jgi:hypothetical protein